MIYVNLKMVNILLRQKVAIENTHAFFVCRIVETKNITGKGRNGLQEMNLLSHGKM